MQLHLERANFGEGQPIVFERPAGLGVSKTGIASATKEAGEARLYSGFEATEKAFESFIYPAQHILQHLGEYFPQIRSLLFNLGQLVSLVIIAEGYTAHAVGRAAFVHRRVVKFAPSASPMYTQVYVLEIW